VKIDERIISAARRVKNKRPKTVIDHIIKHGYITTEELKSIYGYNHPPRAVRDVREEGVPLETYRVVGSDGRKIAAYKFGNPDDIKAHRLGGRKVFSKNFKKKLVELYNSRCVITNEMFDEIYLQIDHRIPYEIVGEEVGSEQAPEKFMLLSGAVQRQKSWSCEHCQNFLLLRDPNNCKTCYWAYPEEYSHVALQPVRRIDILWREDEIKDFEAAMELSEKKNISLQEYIKAKLKSEN
jgi:hypothetical protein